MKRSSLLIALCLLPITVSASSDPESFWEQRERGWFWHEAEEQKVEEDEPVERVPSPSAETEAQEPKQIPLDADWLEKNIPILMRNAINNPTTENLAAYAYAQRLMKDMSSRFSTRMMEFMALEHQLSEEVRRPTSAFSLRAFNDETSRNLRNAMNRIGDSALIWFFFRSDCGYCQRQIPILQELARRYELEVLAVSLDGYSMPGLEAFEHVYDADMAAATALGVRFTPTIFVVGEDGVDYSMVGEGLTTLPQLENALLIASRENGYITPEEYMLATSVKDVNVVKRDDGVIMADRDLLESDPGYLAEMLRARLEGFELFGRTPIGDR